MPTQEKIVSSHPMLANKSLFVIQEILWLLIACTVACAVVYPLYSKLNFIFLTENFVFAATAVLLIRLIIFFKTIVWLKPKWVRFLLGVLAINYFVFVLNIEQKFLFAHDSFNIIDLGEPRQKLSLQETEHLFQYFHNETHLIVVILLICLVLLVIRLIGSYWSLSKTRLYSDTEKN